MRISFGVSLSILECWGMVLGIYDFCGVVVLFIYLFIVNGFYL